MKVLMWHVHGAWATSFVHGPFDVVVPLDDERSPWGRGRPTTYHWPRRAREVPLAELLAEDLDAIVLQRPEELELVRQWLRLEPGRDLPAVYVEHNSPPSPAQSLHPIGQRRDIPLVHVTAFNALMWDNGGADTQVIEHGVPDPGLRWSGTLPRAAFVVNEPVRRNRVTGTDLLPWFADVAPVDAFGIGTEQLRVEGSKHEVVGRGDVAHDRLLDEIARRGLYLHLCRWTSLGLALIEAMMLGMPVVALATTEAPEALHGSGVFLSNDPARLARVAEALIRDREGAGETGRQARRHALERFSLARFHADWDRLMKEVTR